MSSKIVTGLSSIVSKVIAEKLNGADMVSPPLQLHVDLIKEILEDNLTRFFKVCPAYVNIPVGHPLQSGDEWFNPTGKNATWVPVWQEWVDNHRTVKEFPSDHIYRRPLIPVTTPKPTEKL